MDHFRSSYGQASQGQSNGWYGNYGNQFSTGQMGSGNPLQQQYYGGWNGWNYSGCNQQQQQPQQQNQSGNKVNYVQLNWNDLLGAGQGGQAPVTSSGTSAFQLAQPMNSSYMHQGQGQFQHQKQEQRTPATFSVSLGNQGDTGNNNGGNVGMAAGSSYEIISPQNSQFQNQVGGTENFIGQGQGDSTQCPAAAVAVSEKVKGPKYSPCGNCKACKFQDARKSKGPYVSYLIRNNTPGSNNQLKK